MSIWRAVAVALDALAPRRCPGCTLPSREAVCEGCVELAMALPRPPSGTVPSPRGLRIHAALPYEPPVRGIVHRAKYRGERATARLLGALVVERLWDALAALRPDVVIPVPLGARRRRARGYNQAALLGHALARQAGVPLVEDRLVRVRETAAQVGLRGAQRRGNVGGAFAWRAPPLDGAAVWLVDDVVTTGATMAAAATALQQAGAGRIEGVAAAMAALPGGVRIAARTRVPGRPGCGVPAPIPRQTVCSTAGEDPQP